MEWSSGNSVYREIGVRWHTRTQVSREPFLCHGGLILAYTPCVLIVDDEPNGRRFFDRILSEGGYYISLSVQHSAPGTLFPRWFTRMTGL
jgi:hypothetical protein